MSLEFLIEITSNFCEGNILGTGAFGQVYKVSTILFFFTPVYAILFTH
jgi:hypothetical protein